jgi:AraC family transcriptional regulator
VRESVSAELPIFTARETHGRVLRRTNRLIAHSQDAGWRSLHAASFEEAPLSVDEPAVGHPSLIYHLARPTRVMRRIEGSPCEQALIGPRRFCITPGDVSSQWRHAGRPEILQVYVRQSVFDRTIQELYGADATAVTLVPRFAIVDPMLEQLAIAILEALRDGLSEDGLYVDTIAQMMAVHLARRHSSRANSTPARAAVGVSRHAVRRLVEFIEAHLADDLSLDTLSAEAGLSPLYMSRVFKAAVGQPPHRYVLGRRVERAKELLRNTETPIAEVACATGFSSQSHLSNWFNRAVGVSPAAYRRHR